MIKYAKCTVLALALTMIFCLSYFNIRLQENTFPKSNLKKINTPSPEPPDNPSLQSPLVIVVCNPNENATYKFGRFNSTSKTGKNGTQFNNDKEIEKELQNLRQSWNRQSQQTATMLKTLLYFSKSTKWRIIVITDTTTTFQRVINITKAFPEKQRHRLQLEHKAMWFPEDYPDLANHWRPCAWSKQFLAETLSEEDAVIYVDSDLLFLGPAEELWWLLTSMNSNHIVSLAPEPFYVMEKNKRYFAGRVGLNTGVMAINLTRARELPGGGVGSAILNEGVIYPYPRHDQDGLNHFLMNKSHLLSEVTSRWNFLPSACMKAAPKCSDCHTAGILILHGADMSFYRSIDAKFNVMYATLVKTTIETDPEELLAQLSGQLALTDTLDLPYPCNNYTNINEALLLRLTDMAIESAEKKRKINEKLESYNEALLTSLTDSDDKKRKKG